ncbi:EF-P lysine aminoacylase EpmA [Pseudolabrys sp.]|uniref:EF-P lysine aminoacylase EpmA n=1 Tax=Pseudolabrys sp. TaxID=1960880 RepID=UPI003D0E7CB6
MPRPNSSHHADRRPVLLARGRIQAAIRGWFAETGFVEVETPALQVSPGNETHLHAFGTDLIGPDGARSPRYLRTSPEFAAKTLLAAGEPRLFEFARVFRNRERGPLHHPEFTMLEWYRASESYETLMEDCAALLAVAAKAAGTSRFTHRDRSIDPFAAPERITVAEAFSRHAGLDLLATLEKNNGGEFEGNRLALASAAAQMDIAVADDDSWGDLFSKIMAEKVEPHLGKDRAVILYEYPIPQAALARAKPGEPRVSERFELYACGVELANAFGELTDPAEQRRRFEAAMAEKQRIHGERYPIDEDFLAALSEMPPASGIALGFDRLAMLATGAPHIEHVLWSSVAAPGAEQDR